MQDVTKGMPVTTCALVAASDFNAQTFCKLFDEGTFDAVYAVDAGLAYLEEIGCMPDVVIGDFDSLGYVPLGTNVERYPVHKDKSDLELAFDRAASERFERIFVFGAIGGRLDHTLASLQMAARFAEEGMAVTFIAPDCALHILVGPGSYDLPQLETGTVSVFSACDQSVGVTERGMEYPLDDAVLSNRTSLGLSNELLGKPASVSVEKGTLYILHPLA